MKKHIKKIIAGLLVGAMFVCGCGDAKDPNDKDVVATLTPTPGQNDPNNGQTENPGNNGNGQNNEQPTTTPTVTPTPTPEPQGGLHIELPNAENLLADYTSVEGLTLEPGSHIAVVVKSTEVEYWVAVKVGMQQAIDDLNAALGYTGKDKIFMTYESPKVENSVDDQVNILDSIVSENPAVICLAAIDMNSCLAQIEAAGQNGIPVIILDSGVTAEDLIYSNCSTNNYAAGKEAAKRLCDAIGGAGQVAVLAHLELSETSVERLNGFKDEVAANYPEVEIVNVSYEDAEDASKLETQMEAVLTLYPDLKGYFCTNQVVAEVALDVLDQDKHEDLQISLVGFDMGEEQMEAIRDGRQLGAICQNPYGMGYVTVIAGARAVLGLENDTFIDAGYQWMDQSNIDLEENARYLYQ